MTNESPRQIAERIINKENAALIEANHAYWVERITQSITVAVAAERERCAKIALAHICTFGSMAEEIHATATAEAIAADIRNGDGESTKSS